jgi:endo-1,4-beta-xylanase
VAPSTTAPKSASVRELADAAGVILGTAMSAELLDDPQHTDTLIETFTSITPENDLKWEFIHPEPDAWNFGPVDRLVDFAEEHDLAVKGHALLWHQTAVHATPDWVLAIDDPDELRTAMREHITTVMERYDGRIDRWDVVNEPLQTVGAEVEDTHFRKVLGDGYLAEALGMARQADVDAELCINETTAELIPAKADALVRLAEGLVADGAPLDCVGIQAHLFGGTVEEGVIAGLVERLAALDVDVAITELDVPVLPDAPDPLEVQADTYRTAFAECFAAGCREITLWGFTDRHTWIDGYLGPGRAPLPFDEDYRPKPALEAIREELAWLADDADGDGTGG